MIDFFKRNAPPGIDLKQEFRVFFIGNLCSVAVSFFAFLDRYLDERRQLFTYVNGVRQQIDGAIMVPFRSLINFCFTVFFFVACFMLGYIIYHYAYYRQGSMSLYLMKRLPKRSELHRRAFTVPCLAVLATFGIALAAILFYYIIYFLATPKACLPYAALREIRR